MKIQILGAGCPKCKKLCENAEAAVRALGLTCVIVKISNIKEIMEFGVMMTPALAIDGTVKSAGRLLTVEEIKKLLAES